MNDVIILKTNIIGGVDKNQAIEYIQDLKNQIEENDRHDEIIDAKGKISLINEKLSDKSRELTKLNDKFNILNFPEAKAEAAAEFIKAIPQSRLNDPKTQKASKELNNLLKDNETKIDSIFARLLNLRESVANISEDLRSTKSRLENIPFDNETPIKEKIKDEPIIAKESTTVEMPEEAPNVTTEDFTEAVELPSEDEIEAAETIEAPIFTEALQEEIEPMYENSVDNFFAELEKLMGSNK